MPQLRSPGAATKESPCCNQDLAQPNKKINKYKQKTKNMGSSEKEEAWFQPLKSSQSDKGGESHTQTIITR